MISIRRVSLGGGYRYLLRSVAAGDGAGEGANPLARYYASSGTPPGVFMGAGLAHLDGGRGVTPGTQVSEEHLERMFAACADPVSGEPVGAAPRAPRGGAPVAGFDITCSPAKSVSVAWALADEATQALIYGCHRRAVEVVLAYAEAEVFRSRSGTNGVVEEDVDGVVAVSFSHWASRSDDPQLHDHLLTWARAKCSSDGRWRTLDSRALYKAVTTLSELYDGALADLLTGALGVGWEERERRHSARARFEVAGVPEALLAEFSQRAGQVAAHVAELRAQFAAAHGRGPTAVEDMRLHQVATIATRPAKSHASLQELTEGWRARAGRHVPMALHLSWVASLAGRNDLPLLCSDDLGEAILADAARAVLEAVSGRHATFSRMNVLAEAHRVLHGVRFQSPADRVEVAERVSRLALGASLPVAGPDVCHTPALYRRPDGSSRLRPESRALYTTQALVDAEARLLAAGRCQEAPAVSVATVARTCQGRLPGRSYALSTGQALAVEKVATSGRALDVLVGPSGTGKSTTMAGLRATWEAEHGPGSVLGLAPTAAAAEVLAAELGTTTENTAKWLTEHRRVPELSARRGRLAAQAANGAMAFSARARLGDALAGMDQAIAARRLQAGQLVIVDEASLAGTFALDELVSAAREAGAKVVLVGDSAQLSAMEAGGAFRLLVADRGDLVPELGDVQRFRAEWEKGASLGLRLGKEDAIVAYEAHGRVTGGEREALLDALYRAWKADIDQGRESLMVAPDSATVSELNGRARADRVALGLVAEAGLTVADGQRAGVGDEVVTRDNNRLLSSGRGWVKNGDRWLVRATNADGSMAVRRLDGKGEVVLPAAYVREHVELAYATTAYRPRAERWPPPTPWCRPRPPGRCSTSRPPGGGRRTGSTWTPASTLTLPPHTRPWPGPRARGQCWPPCWPGKVPSSRPTRRSGVPSNRRGPSPCWPPSTRPSPGTLSNSASTPSSAGVASPNQTWPRPIRARLMAPSWLRSGRPKPADSTSTRLYRSWRPPAHWPGPTTPSPSCTTGPNAGPPPPVANARPVPASSPASSLGHSAWTTRTWPAPCKNGTGPWNAGPGSWPNRRWPRAGPGWAASGQHRSRRAGGKPGYGLSPPWLRSGTAGRSAMTLGSLALRSHSRPWRGWGTAAVPKRPSLAPSDWPT